jgi:hypothetical protein
MKVETLTEEVFQARKKAAEERRAIKAEEAATLAEMVEKGEIDQPLRNGRQGKGEWRDGVYRMDDFDPIAYLRLIDDLNAKTPARVDPDVAFIQLLSAKFPTLQHLAEEELLIAACSRLFDADPDKLLSRACQKLEALQGLKSVSCGELVSRYRRQPEASGSNQSLTREDIIAQGGDV